MQQQLQDLDLYTLQSIFIKASKEFTEATRKRIDIEELSNMYESIKEIYATLQLKKLETTLVLN